MKKTGKLILFTAVAILGASCSKEPDTGEGGSGASVPEGTVTVNVVPDHDRILLKNPLSGWATYSGIGTGLARNYWELYDSFDCKDAPDGSGKVRVWDYSNVLYIKADWSAMNPADNMYIWEDEGYDYAVSQGGKTALFAENLKYLMDGAKERGLKIAFTINTNSEGDEQSSTPEFVRDAGAKGFWAGTNRWTGYPDDKIFQKYYEKFVKAFAARFNNPDEVEYISGLGLGKWGECHSFRYSTEVTIGPKDESPRWDVYDWATSMYADNFTNVPVVTNYHKMVGKCADSGSADQMSIDLLNLAISKGFCMRHDAFGMQAEYYGTWEKNFIAGHRYEVPVIGEGGWVLGTHDDWQNHYGSEYELRNGEYTQMESAYVNMMDFRYNKTVSQSETYSWFNHAYDLVLKFLREGVYRLFPNRLYMPQSAESGSKVTIESRWSNLGNAYFPANLKQWHGRYKLAYALLGKGSLKPVHIFVDTEGSAALHTVYKNAMRNFKTDVVLEGVAPGTYTWGVAIVNTEKENTPAVELSVREQDLTEEGWLKLSDVTVR